MKHMDPKHKETMMNSVQSIVKTPKDNCNYEYLILTFFLLLLIFVHTCKDVCVCFFQSVIQITGKSGLQGQLMSIIHSKERPTPA